MVLGDDIEEKECHIVGGIAVGKSLEMGTFGKTINHDEDGRVSPRRRQASDKI